MEQIAQENLQKWTDGLLTKDASVMTGFYREENLSFLPTLDSRHIKNAEDAKNYFEKEFLPKSPKCIEVKSEVADELSESCYFHAGKYTFEVGPENDRTTAEARFTYVWKLEEGGQWRISHHHSSLLPV